LGAQAPHSAASEANRSVRTIFVAIRALLGLPNEKRFSGEPATGAEIFLRIEAAGSSAASAC
jgi:hypothetical protein